MDTWWQTETGAILISPLPGATPLKPGTATLPFFGVDAAIVDDKGKEVPHGESGKLVIRKPWPSMLRTIYGDKARYKKTYWSEVKGCYFTGDGARRDKDGYFWIVGRIDDVLNVAGHRLSTGQMEEVLAGHPDIAECAVIGVADALKGQAPLGLVVLKAGVNKPNETVTAELVARIREHIGPVAAFREARVVARLPKTRSGKILRQTLRKIADREEYAVPPTIDDPAILDEIKAVLGC
jgi:acyl-coenzyme A synthetase/AMP-(fatty) acid ligase